MAARASSVVVALLVLGLAGTARAVTINVDGSASDWGISPGSDWVPYSGISYTTSVGSLTPGGGGHPFDAEAIYFTYDATNAYFAIVTGMPPTGTLYGGSMYHAGDLLLKAGGSWVAGITTTAASYDSHVTVGAGHLFANPSVHLAYSFPNYPTTGANGGWITGGTDLGTVPFYYVSAGSVGGDQYLMEVSVPRSELPSGDFKLHWTQDCGNDVIELGCNLPNYTPPVVPEPATCTLFGAGLLAFLAARARRKGRQAKTTAS